MDSYTLIRSYIGNHLEYYYDVSVESRKMHYIEYSKGSKVASCIFSIWYVTSAM